MPMVGGFPEPDGSQPMSPAEFRMVREYLGLTGETLAEHLGVTLRSVRRWEHGHRPVSDGIRQQMEHLEETAARHVGELVDRLGEASDLVLSIPSAADSGWWRMIAARVAAEVPGLYVRYLDEAGSGQATSVGPITPQEPHMPARDPG